MLQKEIEIQKEQSATFQIQNESLKIEVGRLKGTQVNQGDLCKEVVAKLFKTVDFGRWCIQLTAWAVSLGKI